MTNKKKLSIGIIWANPYNRNLGVAALAYSSLALIKDVLDEQSISADFTFVTDSQKPQDSLVVNGRAYEFNTIIDLNVFQLKSLIKLCAFPKRYGLIKRLLFDYIFDIAAGDSFTDIYGEKRFCQVLNSKKFYTLLGKKQILLPQTIGPFNKVNEKKAFTAMQKIDYIISRDKQSFLYTQKYLSNEKVAETIDIAFYMPFFKKTFSSEKTNVGINVSGLLWNGGYTLNNQFNLKIDYKNLIRNIIDLFAQLKDVKIHLISHVLSEKENSVEDDYRICKLLQNEFSNTILAPWFTTPIEAKSYISGLDFFIGARMHACIAAFSTGVSVFPLAYSRKFNGLFIETLQYNWMGDCVNETENIILDRLKDAFNKRMILKEQIKHSNTSIVQPRLSLLKSIISNSINK